MKEPGPAFGRRHEPNHSVGASHGRSDGIEGVIGNSRGLVNENHGDSRVAANRVGIGRNGDDARAVREEEGDTVEAILACANSEFAQESLDFQDQLVRLADDGRDDKDQRGRERPSAMDRERGQCGALAPLPVATENASLDGRIEDRELLRLRVEVQFGLREPERVRHLRDRHARILLAGSVHHVRLSARLANTC